MEQGLRDVIEQWHDMMVGSTHDGLFELLPEDCFSVPGCTHASARQRHYVRIFERSESGLQ